MYLAFEFNLFFHLQSVEVFNPGASVDESDEFVMMVFDVRNWLEAGVFELLCNGIYDFCVQVLNNREN